MLNKILVFGGISLLLIVVFTNMISVAAAVSFLWIQTSVWMLCIICTLIGIGIGIGLKSMFNKGDNEDNYDF